jgi:hypothetical protein
MKKAYRFGFLFALLTVFGLFACNENSEEEEIIVNDSPFVGVWNLKSSALGISYDLLDSLDNVIGKRELPIEKETFDNATLEFKENYTALGIINGENGSINTSVYLWEDLGNKLVLRTVNTYEKPIADTMNIAKSDNAVTLTTTRKYRSSFEELIDFYDEELDSTYQVTKRYPAIQNFDITIDIEK